MSKDEAIDLTNMGVSFTEAMTQFEAMIEAGRREWAARQLVAYPWKRDLEITAEALLNDIKTDAVEVNSILDSRQETLVKAPPGPPVSIPMENSLCVLTVGLERPSYVKDVQNSPFTENHAVKERGLQAWASAPIFIEGCVAGTICALESDMPRDWNRGDQALLEKAAALISDQVGHWAVSRKHSI